MVEHTRKELLTKIKAHLDKNEDKKPRKGGKSYATKKQGALLAYAKKLGVVKASDTVVPAVGSPAYKARAKKAAAAKKSPAKKSPKKADKKSPAKAKSPKKAGKKSPAKAGKKSPAKSPAKGGKRVCPAEIKRATVKLTLKSASRDGKACSYKLTRVNKTK